ncbi:helix-turn-helix domain-containing protein [Bacillus sp. EB01]|uniref:helix-turn-helix domain-containing protein n=1 Tax=Bacillus sp. EB01 TaxID=1347086 RepID=UPI0006931F65|nr:helix-turn-helix domain-containing protein [Bacillus sp. EB01]
MGFHLKLPNIKFLQIEGQNWNDTLHSHKDVYQISIPLQGEMVANLNGKENVLTEGQSIVANPHSMHGHQFEGRTSSFIIVGLNREALNNWAKERFSILDEIEFNENQRVFTADLQRQMKLWLTPYLFENKNSNPLTIELENEIFSYFSGILKGSHQVRRRTLHVASDMAMDKVIEYIHTNYTDELTIEQMAELAQQSVYHFMRSFKKLTKFTPHQYILTLRIEKGKDLLCHSTKTITEIAYDLGFSSPTSFYRNFVRIVGCTPKQYRVKT